MKKIISTLLLIAVALCGFSQSLFLPVKRTASPVIFNQNNMSISVASNDFVNGVVYLSVEVHDTLADKFDTSKYVNHIFMERSIVKIPSSAFSAAFSSGKLNLSLWNQYLGSYNLAVDTARLRAQGSNIYP